MIEIHIIAALVAVVLGGGQFVLPKGTARHRFVGLVWFLAMVVVCARWMLLNQSRLDAEVSAEGLAGEVAG